MMWERWTTWIVDHWRVALPKAGHWLRRATPAGLAVVVGIAVIPPLWGWTRQHPYFALGEVTVIGPGRLTREEVLATAGIRFGVSTWDIDCADAVRRLEAQAWIQSASVRTQMPNGLRVTIHERKPLAIVRWESLHYVDRRGHLLGPLSEQDSRDFPVITGIDSPHSRERAHVTLPRVAHLLRWCERNDCFDSISEVRVDLDRSLTLYPMEPPVAVVLGWGGWKDKLRRWKRVRADYAGSESQLLSVDLSYRGSAIVKLKQEPPPAARANVKRGGTKI